MKPIACVLLAAGATLWAGATAATVTVTFDKPEQFADMPITHHERDATLKSLREHFEKLGGKLPAGQDLKVDVLDVDLAGRLKPSTRGPMDLRVLTGGADWPMIRLRYAVEANGKVVKSGEDRVTDMNYMNHINHYFDGEPLRYEKHMLDVWFSKAILDAR